MSDDKTAVILSGGGAYASYEVGVLRALVNGDSPATGFRPLSPEIFTGTSGGAINAAVMVSEQLPREGCRTLEETWLGMTSGPGTCGNSVYRLRGNLFQFADPGCYMRGISTSLNELAEDGAFFATEFLQRSAKFLNSDQPVGQRALELLDFTTFLSTGRVHEVLRRVVIPRRIRESPLVLRIAATNWQTGSAVVFHNHDFSEEQGNAFVTGSAAIPGIFPPHMIDGVPYVDGTVVENTPLLPALRTGASTMHIVQHPNPDAFPPSPVSSALETFYRTIVIMLDVLLKRDIRRADEINRGLQVLHRLSAGEEMKQSDLGPVARMLTKRLGRSGERAPYRPLTIHRYIPTHDFGGLLGLLDFSREAISTMIEQGYRDTVAHDCEACGCLLPQQLDFGDGSPGEIQEAAIP